MVNYFGTEVFWLTLIITPVILGLVTFIGYLLCKLFPGEFRTGAGLYLAPVIGLGTVVIIVSLIGRLVPLGNLNVIIFILGTLLILAFIYKHDLLKVFANSFTVSLFGIICGVSILIPLFIYGAFNPHNDAFTYLAQSSWLQGHAFSAIIPAGNVTPLTTQIFLYQLGGLRMGGSFLLAFIQSLFRLHWSFDAYPAVVIVAVAVCCLAIGFPIIQAFPKIKRRLLLLLISLPALSLGGLVFGANFGFLPQTIGLALGVGFLVTAGFSLHLIIEKTSTPLLIGKLAFLSALLFSGATLAYSEIMPFLLLAFLFSGLFLSIRFLICKNIFIFYSLFAGFSAIILLNFEIPRVLKALLTQSSAVVGTPVDWPLFGYISHAFGIHGGAWDIMQWSIVGSIKSPLLFFCLLFVGFLAILAYLGRRLISKSIADGTLMPIFMLLIISISAFVYFRYFVASPFSTGTGQSWSQFKLSDWINPFLMVIILFFLVALQSRLGRLFDILIFSFFIICLAATIFTSINRIQPLIQYYGQTHNLNRFYIDFRNKVNAVCPANIPIYLNFGDSDLKFRQMAVLYLYDREVKSDWMNDGYIYEYLPVTEQNQEPTTGDCVVESGGRDELLESSQRTKIGQFYVGIFQGSTNRKITDIVGV